MICWLMKKKRVIGGENREFCGVSKDRFLGVNRWCIVQGIYDNDIFQGYEVLFKEVLVKEVEVRLNVMK